MTEPTENISFTELRKSLGLRHREVAAKIGISQQYWIYIEKKQKRPSYWLIPAIAKVFNISSEEVEKRIKPENQAPCKAS